MEENDGNIQTESTKSKTWFRGLLHSPATNWIRSILQLPGSARGKLSTWTNTRTGQVLVYFDC